MNGNKYHRLSSCCGLFLFLAATVLTGCPANRQAEPPKASPPAKAPAPAAAAPASSSLPGTASASDAIENSLEKTASALGKLAAPSGPDLSRASSAKAKQPVDSRLALASAAPAPEDRPKELLAAGTKSSRPVPEPTTPHSPYPSSPSPVSAGQPLASPGHAMVESVNPIRPQGSAFMGDLPPAAGTRPNPLRPLPDNAAPLQPVTNATSGAAGKIVAATAAAAIPGAAAPNESAAADKSAAPKPRKGKHSGTVFDPVKENGAIFQNWPKPQLAILVSGRIEGYLEPCGCAGLDRMKGGISRRQSLIQKLRQEGWPLVKVDVGGLAKGFGRQSEMKFHVMVEAYKKMGYDAIGLGTTDLRLQAAELVSVTKGVAGEPSPFVSANIGLFSFAARMIEPYRIVEAAGRKIGIAAVFGKQYFANVRNAEIELADPAQKLAEILPELKKQAQYLILLAFAPLDETQALARQFPDFRLVVTAGGGPEQPANYSLVPGTQIPLIEVGEKGMDVVVLGLYEDPQNPLRYQRVPLDSRFPASPEMRALMESYQEQIKMLGFGGLGIRAVPYPQRDLMGAFVGSAKCADCHEPSYRIWKKSGHAKGYTTLEKTDPPRNFDPECVSCHVVGWNPQQYFPYEGGFLSKEKTPQLQHVGCEDCHGPGEAHCKAEQGSDLALQKKLQKAVAVTKADAEKHLCRTCHDLDNSPDFEFSTYWPLVEHYEKDKDKK